MPEPQAQADAVQTAIAPKLLRAYQQAEYRVLGNPRFSLRVGAYSAELAALHTRHAVACSAFITACNPGSVPAGDSANATRHALLRKQLAKRGLQCIEGAGLDPNGQWPSEPSWLVLGLALDAARELAGLLGQNALLWAGADARPRLILLR